MPWFALVGTGVRLSQLERLLGFSAITEVANGVVRKIPSQSLSIRNSMDKVRVMAIFRQLKTGMNR